MADLPADIEQLIARTRQAQQPTAADRARIGRQLAAKLSVPAAGSFTAEPEAPPPSAAASHAPWAVTAPALKLTLALVLGAAAATTWMTSHRDTGGEQASVPSSPIAPPSAPEQSSAVERAGAASQPAAEPVAPKPQATEETSPESREGTAQLRAAAPRRTANVEHLRGGGLARELRLTRAAASAIDAGGPARALRLLDQHASEFPRGALSPERDALRIAALCKLGRLADASALREEFDAQHSQSPLRMRIAADCDALEHKTSGR